MAMSKGCTIALIISAALVLLILVVVIIVWINKDKIIEAGLNQIVQTVETEIVTNLPDGYTPESVHQIMEELKAGIKSGKISSPAIQELAVAFKAAMDNDKKIDKDEGLRLLKLIEGVLGRESAVPNEAPSDSIPDTTLQAAPDSV